MSRFLITSTDSLPPLPLALYSSFSFAHAMIEPFGECDIYVGLDTEMVRRLIAKSQDMSDEALLRTSDRKRFVDQKGYEIWFGQNRTPFVLMNRETKDLMALVWIGPKPLGTLPLEHIAENESSKSMVKDSGEQWDTVSFRSYTPYRGGGFMTVFTKYILEVYKERYPTHHLWVSIDRNNIASQALAEKLGFILRERGDESSDRITMTL